MNATVLDPRACHLGEGAFWHPLRRQFFWFDIVNGHLLSQDRTGPRLWKFPEMVSAAGWVSEDVLLIAGERDLFLFDLETEEVESLVDLEAGNPSNRSNDGRADRQGGFWIGTMAKASPERKGAGAIYRFFKGERIDSICALALEFNTTFGSYKYHDPYAYSDEATACMTMRENPA